jgi:hypothetical protein
MDVTRTGSVRRTHTRQAETVIVLWVALAIAAVLAAALICVEMLELGDDVRRQAELDERQAETNSRPKGNVVVRGREQ